VYVTENGIGLQDVLTPEGTVDDEARIEFVKAHLMVIARAIADGVNVKGYYMWSLMDNFSWINGYKKQYGLLYIDRHTLQRYKKKSALWFQKVIEQNGFAGD
jgi:beta-glucosidase/6-phospho-beta-glucosidase/beta-galactosidase